MRALLSSLLLLCAVAACRLDAPHYSDDDSTIDAGHDGAIPSDGPLADPAMLTASEESHDFTDVTIDEASSEKKFTITNSGGSPSGLLTVEASPAAFEIVPTQDAADCANRSLDPNETCIAQVRFHPTVPGAIDGTVEVSATPGGTVSIDVHGNGLTPGEFAITGDESLDFTAVEIGQTSAVQTITVQNNGTAPTADLEVTVGDPDNYTLVNDTCNAPIPTGLTCTVGVRFNPSVVGSLPTQISVHELLTPAIGDSASASGSGSGELTVTKTGIGTVVSVQQPGINCAGACLGDTASFTETPITLTATPDDVNHVFESWSGECEGVTSSTCSPDLLTATTNVGVVFRELECTPSTIVCNDSTSHYVDCSDTGEIELEMDCALGCAVGVEKCLDVNPSNGLAGQLDLTASAGSVTFTGSSTIDTTTGAVVNGGIGITPPTDVVDGIRVFRFDNLNISGTLTVSGTSPLAFVANGAVTIDGLIDVSANTSTAGPGAITSGTCTGASPAASTPVGGGGGAGRYNVGGAGGNAGTGTSGGTGGLAFVPTENPIVPLHGGCAGGTVGTGVFRARGGGGGGALQIVSRTTITLTGTGTIDASGGGGGRGGSTTGNRTGGGGGGGGGAVLLEAPQVVLNGGSVVLSTKGGSGAAPALSGEDTARGSDGGYDATPAPGGTNSGLPTGGAGGTEQLPGAPGGPGTTSTMDGAGGGASVGQARFNTQAGVIAPQNGASIRSRYSTGTIGSRQVP